MKSAKTVTNRERCFDYMRAFCCLYIVGVWHLSEYANIDLKSYFLFPALTNGTLAAFTFISGYFMGLGKNSKITCMEDVKRFLSKRLIRLYPLFALSAVTLFALDLKIHGGRQLLLTLTGLSMYFTPAPGTLWFVVMIFTFYVYTVIINYQKSREDKIRAALIIYLYLLVFYNMIYIDNRSLKYFPIYAAALIFGDKIKQHQVNWKELFFWFLGFLAVSMVVPHTESIRPFLEFIETVFFVGFLYTVSKMLEHAKIPHIYHLIYFISTASMCMYLFHRQFYYFVQKLFGVFDIAISVVSVIILTVVSYEIQMLYNRIMRPVTRKI